MENFNLAYNHIVENYFNPDILDDYDFENGYFDGLYLGEYSEAGIYLNTFNNLRSIIKRDMQKILEINVNSLNNNSGLVQELNTIIDTIDNGIDFDFMHGNNFAFMTDEYLCFNNFENYVDELEWDSLGEDASSRETVVIIDRHLRKFYFIRTTKKVSSASCSTTINAYQVRDKNVKKSKVNLKNGLSFIEHTDEGIKKVLSILK